MFSYFFFLLYCLNYFCWMWTICLNANWIFNVDSNDGGNVFKSRLLRFLSFFFDSNRRWDSLRFIIIHIPFLGMFAMLILHLKTVPFCTLFWIKYSFLWWNFVPLKTNNRQQHIFHSKQKLWNLPMLRKGFQ